MTFGKQISKTFVWSLACCALFLPGSLALSYACENWGNTEQPTPNNESPVSLDVVLKSLEQSTLFEQTFHETYYSGMLMTPSHKEGTLLFFPPDRLEKHVRIPTEESFIINGNSLLYENPAREISQTFSLEDYPALAILIEGLRAIFNNNKHTLQKFFEISVAGTLPAWTLHLAPIIQNEEDGEEDGVECIRLAGSSTHLHTISIEEKNGDRSELQLDLPVP